MFSISLLLASISSAAWASDPPVPCVDAAAVLASTERAFPTRYRDLLELRREDPERFAHMLHSTAHALEDPTLIAALERVARGQDRLDRAAAAWNKAPKGQRTAQQAELEAAATALVDLNQAARRARIGRVREMLSTLNAELQDIENNRDTAIQDAIDQATR